MRVKISPLDKLFSEFIKKRAGWKCERCGNMPDKRGLHCHHYERRRKKSVRFDPDNGISLCLGCHQFLGENHDEEKAFMIHKLGQEGLDMLQARARTPARYIDKNAITLYLKAQIKELGG